MEPAPIRPRQPVFETAAQSFHPDTQTMPPWMMGYWIPKRFCISESGQIRFFM